ncbi:hypothetical protein [Granulicella arctica]|uniref:Protein-S-isoprenylcysteine O-methyltransferase Ste14 n=1 Tax=Granulicella arctica TaxID=940613 RepID=A0A7Y9TG78_9BACT|nr:hypothetical protein [Granulicella arctica]NYF79209.1 protein-S-isoprenylcysteine O-methyltransferase Ste14 [Granulicella arctica]
MSLSYQEKSIWTSLITQGLIFGYYFGTVGWTSGHVGNLFVGAVVLSFIVQIFYPFVGTRSRTATKDERDRAIEGKAYRNAYHFLVVGVILMLFNGLTGTVFGWPIPGGQSVIFTANLMILLLALTQIFKSATQLILYRRDV